MQKCVSNLVQNLLAYGNYENVDDIMDGRMMDGGAHWRLQVVLTLCLDGSFGSILDLIIVAFTVVTGINASHQ